MISSCKKICDCGAGKSL